MEHTEDLTKSQTYEDGSQEKRVMWVDKVSLRWEQEYQRDE